MDLGADRETFYAEQRARSTHATVGEVIIVRIAKVRRGPPADGPLAWPPERLPDTARKTAPAWLSTDAGADDDADDEDYVLPGAHAAPGGARSTRGRRRGHRPFRPADCDAVRQGDQPAMQGGRGGLDSARDAGQGYGGGEGGIAVPTLCALDELQCQLCDYTHRPSPARRRAACRCAAAQRCSCAASSLAT